MPYSILIPILNKKVTMFPGPVWYLSEGISIRKISEKHYSAAHKFGGRHKDDINIESKCIQYSNIKDLPDEEDALQLSICACYALTHFSNDLPPILGSALVFDEKQRGPKVSAAVDLPEIFSASLAAVMPFRTTATATSADISLLFRLCRKAITKHLAVRTTLERYIAGRSKKPLEDRAIDTAISLESLIPGGTEISYKFCLYNSIISSDEKDRRSSFDRFKTLYDARSAIVHGDMARARGAIEKLKNMTSELNDLVGKAIFYYIVFLNKNDPVGWKKHLEGLALGIEEKISGEGIEA